MRNGKQTGDNWAVMSTFTLTLVRSYWITYSLTVLLATNIVFAQHENATVKLIVRGDDFGYTHASNTAMVQAFEEGIMTSASLLAPTPWFSETADIVRKHTEWSIGIHLTITSEWNRLRWGPLNAISEVPSLVAPDGKFWGWGYSRPRPIEFNASSAPWAEHDPEPAEVEKEFRAQIEHAKRLGIRIDYIDCHMGMGCREELLPIMKKLAEENCLAISSAGLYGEQRFAPDYPPDNNPLGIKRALMDALLEIKPGIHLYVGHPATQSPELLAVDSNSGDYWYRRRSAVLAAWIDPEVRDLITRLKIDLVPMREFVPQGCRQH